jgi:hypothetical protein
MFTLDWFLILVAAILAFLSAIGVPSNARVHLGWLAFGLFLVTLLTP